MNKGMTLNEYQVKAMSTCLPSCENFSYMFLNLVGEVGEFAGKIAKHIRKEHYSVVGDVIARGKYVEDIKDKLAAWNDLKSECGDILWQLAGLCEMMGWRLEDVAQQNIDKLAARKEQGTIITHTDH